MMVEPKTHSEIILSGEKKLISKLFPIDKLLKIDWIIWSLLDAYVQQTHLAGKLIREG